MVTHSMVAEPKMIHGSRRSHHSNDFEDISEIAANFLDPRESCYDENNLNFEILYDSHNMADSTFLRRI